MGNVELKRPRRPLAVGRDDPTPCAHRPVYFWWMEQQQVAEEKTAQRGWGSVACIVLVGALTERKKNNEGRGDSKGNDSSVLWSSGCEKSEDRERERAKRDGRDTAKATIRRCFGRLDARRAKTGRERERGFGRLDARRVKT